MTGTHDGVPHSPKEVSTEGIESDSDIETGLEDVDKHLPMNWSKAKKWWITMVVSLMCFAVAFASAVITPTISAVAKEFHTPEEVSLLAITLFVIGFGIGPLVASPLSELYGRKPMYVITFGIAVVFTIPCAVAKNIQTLLVCRAIDGVAFSTPMALVGGTLADLWHKHERAVPMAVFSAAPFMGPIIGPLVGGYVFDTIGWRWTYWLQLILSGVSFLLCALTVPETYAPLILKRRAKKLEKQAGGNTHLANNEPSQSSTADSLKIYMIRPFQLLFEELIVFLLSLYAAVIYGLLYMFFVAYPIIFGEGKGWSQGSTGLMFIPLAGGTLISTMCSPWVNQHYLKIAKQHGGHPPPETRLIPMMLSCWTLPIGMFINAWTSYPRLTWVGPCLAGIPIGIGFVFLYNSLNNYIVDSYQHVAASALAAKTLFRSIWGGCTVLFTIQMYHRLGYQWASSLLAFISLACCIIPFVLYKWGPEIRKRSHYAYYEPGN